MKRNFATLLLLLLSYAILPAQGGFIEASREGKKLALHILIIFLGRTFVFGSSNS